MANIYKFETRDQRIERMKRDNPGRPIELCTAVVDGIWNKKKEAVLERIPERFKNADTKDLGYLTEGILFGLEQVLSPPDKNDVVGLVFSGPAGSGKTHAAYAVMKFLADKNPETIAYMADYPEAIQALRKEFVKDIYNDLGSVWDKLNNDSGMYDGIILLDDVSSNKQTDFETDKLLAVVNHRVNNFKPFIITTNLKQDEFTEAFGERIASRLLGYCKIIEFKEEDKRFNDHE